MIPNNVYLYFLLGTHSNREKYLTMFEDIKDDDDAVSLLFVFFLYIQFLMPNIFL